MASELPRSARSNRSHKHSWRQIIKERDPGRVVLVRAEADKESPFDVKSIITFMKIYHPTRGKADQAEETELHLGCKGSLGWNEKTEKPIGTLRARSKLTGMVRVHCNTFVSVFVAMERWLPLQCAAPNQLTHATAPFPQPSSAGSRQLPCLLEWPEGPKQFSPGQSAAPPWVDDRESTDALKGPNSHYLVIATRVLPLQGIRSRVVLLPRAALRSALGFDVYARWAMLLPTA